MRGEPIIRNLDAGECYCPNQHPHLDEFVARDVTVHFEAMGDAQFWIGVEDKATGRFWHINCGAVNERARGYAFVEEDSPWQDDPRPGDGVFPSSKLSAEQRRVVADVLRDCARDFREAS